MNKTRTGSPALSSICNGFAIGMEDSKSDLPGDLDTIGSMLNLAHSADKVVMFPAFSTQLLQLLIGLKKQFDKIRVLCECSEHNTRRTVS